MAPRRGLLHFFPAKIDVVLRLKRSGRNFRSQTIDLRKLGDELLSFPDVGTRRLASLLGTSDGLGMANYVQEAKDKFCYVYSCGVDIPFRIKM